MKETRRSQKIARLRREVTAALKKIGATKTQVMEIAEKFRELDAVRERMIMWGDEWAKDDHPHAILARAHAVGALSTSM
jgi:hypothetical protein